MVTRDLLLIKAAEKIAAYANTCCGRSDGYEEDVRDVAYAYLVAADSGSAEDLEELLC